MTTEQQNVKPAETISVARAMVWLKHAETDLKTTIPRLGCGGVFKNGKDVRSGKELKLNEEAVKANQSHIDDILAVIVKRRLAVAESNFTTKVNIAGREMSIAEALIFKAHVLPHLEAWVKHVTGQNRALNAQYVEELRKWEDTIKDKTPEEIAALRAVLEPTLVDSTGYVESKIKFIEEFERDLDAALNESNALTTIIL